MTDYASQRKNRPKNVAHLSSCFTHMSYYTCLSHSTTADSTIIMQGFDPSIITRGCSGYLRQEFREHEILNDITRLRYESLLPNYIEGSTRNSIIRQYQQWKGEHYILNQVDIALHRSTRDPLEMPVVTDSQWQIIDKSRKKNLAQLPPPVTTYIPAKGTKVLNLKQKSNEIKPVLSKKRQNTINQTDDSPTGFI